MSSSPEFELEFRNTMLNVTMMESLAHGIYTTVVVFTLWMIAVNEKHRARIFMGAVIVTMYLIATTHLIVRWCYVRGAFISHGQTDETQFDYLFNAPKWMLISSVSFTLNTIIADFVVVWRCWTVWEQKWIVAVIPSLCNIVGIGMRLRVPFRWLQYVSASDDATTRERVERSSDRLALAVHVYIGGDKLTQLQSHRSYKFSKVICTLIESAAMYAVSMIVTLAFYKQGGLDANFPISITSTVTGLAPALIVAQVVCGSTRPATMWQEPPRSILEFNRTLDPTSTFPAMRLDIHEDSGASTSSDERLTERESDPEKEWGKDQVGDEAV
ncbi:uncharacterized protein BT62DRAFT_915547 [Guyanagaster necrorhizus]|uniref:Uncharacterized protein n=1 Tax=Guyanagaster necrorhizus TaxID=856835 RepID=A0A9P7W701_9AGAR|nr:uncharacterized protein BT62DRAFT_915547 [Guyanagaster necrorhizus MCA 3950]KAG7453293.1 hypothetical protein BT62DRAFT_915547 [Guyanagaster necrorhizus MCA 3950]